MTPLLSARGLGRDFVLEGGVFRRRIGAVAALRNVSFDLAAGESLGLVGESGSGKTTLGRLLCRLYEPSAGEVLWEGRPAASFSRRDWALNVQMIFQDPSASLNPKLSVATLLSEPLRLRARADGEGYPPPAVLLERLARLLADVGLPPDAAIYYPHQFSGGQKQRLAIARALAIRPRVLVADEPVSALDLSIQAQIMNLFMDLKDRYRLTTIVISHDLAVVSHLADRLLVLKDGEAVESGPTAEVLARPSHPYTRALIDAVPAMSR